MHEKPLIGVSRCLLGHAMRYDGKSNANAIVIEQLGDLFELVPVCPEVEAGLAVPRPPVQLSGSIEHPRLTGRNDPCLDVTELMLNYCNSRPVDLDQLSGFVFKSRSPSCGLNSTPVFINGACVTETGSGLFARAMAAMYPGLPAIEDDELENPDEYQQFIDDVYQYMSTINQGF
jgi:uncharacterized protein YbbK (DUF523 family)